MAVLVDDVGGVVTGQLDQCQVLLGHETLLESSMTEAMEGKFVWIGSHFFESVFEPDVELVAKDRSKIAIVILGLEQGRVSGDVGVTNHVPENIDCAYGTKKRTRIIAGQWDFLDSFAMLDSFSEVELEKDAGNALMLETTNIPPAHQTDFIHCVVGNWHEGRCSEHSEEIE